MSAMPMSIKPEKVLTGRRVLTYFVLFICTFVTANMFLVYFAKTTFRGLDAKNSYEAGLVFDREIDAVRAQDKLNWKFDVAATRQGDVSFFTVNALNDKAAPIEDLKIQGLVAHPADSRRDVTVAFEHVGKGQYRGSLPLTVGLWDLIIDASQGDKKMYRSKNRITVK